MMLAEIIASVVVAAVGSTFAIMWFFDNKKVGTKIGNTKLDTKLDTKNVDIKVFKNPPQFHNLFEEVYKNTKMTPLSHIAHASYALPNGITLTVVEGSVVNFDSDYGAIVTAANERLAAGGGVDRAILRAGGFPLIEDRANLPTVKCLVGRAVITGPTNYDNLRVPYIIHAVGPNFSHCSTDEERNKAIQHLHNAYRNSLFLTVDRPILHVGMPLISAGIFRGKMAVEDVIAVGIRAIHDWAANLKERIEARSVHVNNIVLFAYTPNEVEAVIAVCDKSLAGMYKIAKL